MNRFDSTRKSTRVTLSLFEDYVRDQNTEKQSELGMILETIEALSDMRDVMMENKQKDKLIGGNTAILKMVQGDIAKMAIREYENSQNMLRFLCEENESLKHKNNSLQSELKDLGLELDQAKK